MSCTAGVLFDNASSTESVLRDEKLQMQQLVAISHPSPPPPIVLLRVICHNNSHFGRNITREANFMSTLSLSLYSPPIQSCPRAMWLISALTSPFLPTLGDPPALSPLWMIAVINGHLRAPYWWRVMQQPPPTHTPWSSFHWRLSVRKLLWQLYCPVIGTKRAPLDEGCGGRRLTLPDPGQLIAGWEQEPTRAPTQLSHFWGLACSECRSHRSRGIAAGWLAQGQ